MIKKVFAAAFAALVALPAAAAAQDVRTQERTVYFGDLDLSEQADAAAMLSRLKRASHHVCRQDRGQPPRISREAERCKAEALTTAVAAVGAPRLSALHGEPAMLRILAAR